MTLNVDLSMYLSKAREEIKRAHSHADTWTEEMEHTAEAIESLGIQHYGRGGEELPDRIIDAHVEAMASLTYSYAEQAYEAPDDELTFFDESQRDKFEQHLDAGHESAMSALRMVESDESPSGEGSVKQ